MSNLTLKIIPFAFLIFAFCTANASGQACGFSFTYLYVRDNNEKPITNVKIEVFSNIEIENEHLKGEATKVNPVKEKQAYLLSHGMCGEHFDVGLKISADGFETLEEKIDLPFLYQSFKVKLKRVGTNEKKVFVQMAYLSGRIKYETPSISSTTIILTDAKGEKTQVRNYEFFQLDVPSGKYKI